MAQKKKCKGKKPVTNQQVQPKALLFNLDEGSPKGDRLRKVLEGFGVIPYTIMPTQLNETAGYLAHVKGFRSSGKEFSGEAPDVEFLLLCDVSAKTMDALLPAMRDADAYIGVKCMLTQHNSMWPLRVLIDQVSKEHNAMARK